MVYIFCKRMWGRQYNAEYGQVNAKEERVGRKIMRGKRIFRHIVWYCYVLKTKNAEMLEQDLQSNENENCTAAAFCLCLEAQAKYVADL